MNRKINGPIFIPQLTKKQVINILTTKAPRKYTKERKLYYNELSEKYNVPFKLIQTLLSETKSRTKDLYERYAMNKQVTIEQIKLITTEIYKQHFNTEPKQIRVVDRYGVVQIVILPERLFVQLDETFRQNMNTFVKALTISLNESISRYKEYNNHNNTKETIVPE